MARDWKALLERCKKEGELAQFSWYASDHSDDPADPYGFVHIVVTDDVGAELVALGAATPVEGGVQLATEYETDNPFLSYASHWSAGVAEVLRGEGLTVELRQVIPPQETRTDSLERGLAQLEHLHFIGASEGTIRGTLPVSRKGKGVFVLEFLDEHRALAKATAALDALRAAGFEVRDDGTTARVNLTVQKKRAVEGICIALEVVYGGPLNTVVAHPGWQPPDPQPW